MFKKDYINTGLLIIRLGIGIALLFHGYPKIIGGMEKWAMLGKHMDVIGIHFFPSFWGFMASISEFGGGILLITGLLFRPACGFLIFTFAIALCMHLKGGDPFGDYSHSLELLVVFLGLLFTGSGKYRLLAKY